MAKKIPLKLAIAEYPHTSKIRDGSIEIEGIEPEFITVKETLELFRSFYPNPHSMDEIVRICSLDDIE